MASMQHAKERDVIAALQKVAENDRFTQALELGSSVAFQAKSVVLSSSLADALHGNTKLTALNLSSCNLGDAAFQKLAQPLRGNATLYELHLDNNKAGRPGLVALGSALAENTGLMSLTLLGMRVNSDVCNAFATAFDTNLTLMKLIWKCDVGGFTLRFTELTNRNTEIDRCVREDKDFTHLLPEALLATPLELAVRTVPDPNDEEFGIEFGEEGQLVWCQVAGVWELGTVAGRRKRKLVVAVQGEEYDFDIKELTPFEPSHARDLPNMVHMQNLHEAPLLYLLQRRLKEGRIYTWAGDVLISLNPYAHIPELYQIANYMKGEKADPARSVAENCRAQLVALEQAAPHAYTLAKRVYLSLLLGMSMPGEEKAQAATDGQHVDQSILISGDSGAGKTEACKRVLEFLTSASKFAKAQRAAAAKENAPPPMMGQSPRRGTHRDLGMDGAGAPALAHSSGTPKRSGTSMAKVPSLAGQSSPSPPPHMAIFGFGLLYALWRSHSATPRALRG